MTPSQQIDAQIESLHDWRGITMAALRTLVCKADPSFVEEWKWNTGIWTRNGMVCAISAFKDHVKINFFRGAELADPAHVFNNGLDSKKHRSIDLFEGDKIPRDAIVSFIHAAVALNMATK